MSDAATLLAGQRVRLRSTGECGVVVHTWRDSNGDEDCYVAFFGSDFPSVGTAPERKPSVLRYAAMSLIAVGAAP